MCSSTIDQWLESRVVVSVVSILGTLLTVFASAYLGSLFAERHRRSDRRLATYEEVTRLAAEYGALLSANKVPDAPFLARAVWVDRDVRDRFSPKAHAAFREMERLLAAGGLPQGVTEQDFTKVKEEALSALRREVGGGSRN
jgi:hypothetical protein